MTHRYWLFLALVLLLLPIRPFGAALQAAEAIDYSRTEYGVSLGSTGIGSAWSEYSSQEAKFVFVVEGEWQYVEVFSGFGGCCPSLPKGSALDVVVTGPGGEQYQFQPDGSDCHKGDGKCPSEFVSGYEWIILVEPKLGIYQVAVTPAGSLVELPQDRLLIVASVWATHEKGNDLHTRQSWSYCFLGSTGGPTLAPSEPRPRALVMA